MKQGIVLKILITLCFWGLLFAIGFWIGYRTGEKEIDWAINQDKKLVVRDTVFLTRRDTIKIKLPGQIVRDTIKSKDTVYITITVPTGGSLLALDTLFTTKWQELLEVTEKIMIKINAKGTLDFNRDIGFKWYGSKTRIEIKYNEKNRSLSITYTPAVLQDLVPVYFKVTPRKFAVGGGILFTNQSIYPFGKLGYYYRNDLLFYIGIFKGGGFVGFNLDF
jgi:hypothetical protein